MLNYTVIPSAEYKQIKGEENGDGHLDFIDHFHSDGRSECVIFDHSKKARGERFLEDIPAAQNMVGDVCDLLSCYTV